MGNFYILGLYNHPTLVECPFGHCPSGRGTKPDFIDDKWVHVGFRASTRPTIVYVSVDVRYFMSVLLFVILTQVATYKLLGMQTPFSIRHNLADYATKVAT